jgi:undecaprenyl diphosphate synthase
VLDGGMPRASANGSGQAPARAGGEPATGLPRHVAFIMDGNGRWARRRGHRRFRGHEQGAEALRRVTRYCRRLGIPEITFFALSTENYLRRPAREVSFLLRLLKSYVISERTELAENDIRLKTIGHIEAFPADLRAEIAETERLTRGHKSMVLRLALNYGGRQEILDAVWAFARDVLSGNVDLEDARARGEDGFRRYLEDSQMTDPDLLIRTGGQCRLSNFLLWQSSYAEIWITPDLWPDFDVPRLEEALEDYRARERKYGALVEAGESRRAPSMPIFGGVLNDE